MGKHKSAGKDKGKGSQLVIRIDKAERSAFVSLCEKLDTSAAREIRRFMREYVAQNSAATEVDKHEASDKATGAVEKAEAEQSASEAKAEGAPVTIESAKAATTPEDSAVPAVKTPAKRRKVAAA